MSTQLEQAARLALDALKKARRKILTTEECHAVCMNLTAALDHIEQPLEMVKQPDQDEPVGIDRSDAVNLARNMLEVRNCKGITSYGVRVLCEAVVKMDAALYTRTQAREPVALNREYAQRLIEELYENGDPVSVDAAEEFERLLTSPQAREPLTGEQIDKAWNDATGGTIVTEDMRAFARQFTASRGKHE